MFHWIGALKPRQDRWVFCACCINGLCNALNWELNFPCTLISSLPHLRQDIGDDLPYSGKWPFLMEAISALSFVNQSEESVSNGGSMWACNCQRPLLPDVFACERILKEEVSAELIPKPPFVSVTLASAAMRHWGADNQTINEEEEEEGRKEGRRVWSSFFFFFSLCPLTHAVWRTGSTCGCLTFNQW